MLSTLAQISWYQRCVIIHSYLYYSLGTSVLDDLTYDKIARELVKLKNSFPDLWSESEYYKQFGDEYNGSTGMGLYDSLNSEQKEKIQAIAHTILDHVHGQDDIWKEFYYHRR